MKKIFFFTVFLTLFNIINVFSQIPEKSTTQIDVSKTIHHFFDETKQAFVVISNDSSYYIFNDVAGYYETKPLNFFTDSTFSHFISEFIPISSSTKGTFFIHSGCGVVYHFVGDSINRHDKSFYHKNQFGGVLFEQNDEIFMYGGYGMFTEKNILVHYNQFMREWIHVDYANDGPTALQYPFLLQSKNGVFSLSGLDRHKEIGNNQAYQFDFTTKHWTPLGTISDDFSNHVIPFLNRTNPFTKQDVLVYNDRIIRTNAANNRFDVYRVQPQGSLLSVKVNPNKPEWTQVHFERTGVKNHFVQVMEWEELLGDRIASGNIWNSPPKTRWFTHYWTELFALLIGVFLMWVTFFVINYRKVKRSAHSRIDFKKIDLQDAQFIALQTLFLTAPEHTVEVSAINPIVEEEGITPDTIKKRRERLIKEFSTAVAIQTGLAPTEIFLEMRHPKDKRIKLLKLSNKLITNE